MRARRRTPGIVVLLAALTSLAGCATITYEAELVDAMVAMNRTASADEVEPAGQMEVSRRAVFLVAELITVADAELDEVIRRELTRTGGDAVLNLRIEERYDFLDVVVALIAGGLVNTRSATIRGDVVQWVGGPDAELEEALSDHCRPIQVPAVGEVPARTGHVCPDLAVSDP